MLLLLMCKEVVFKVLPPPPPRPPPLRSGGHFNPAVTAGVAVVGGVNLRLVIPYWVSQLVGGMLGALLARVRSRTDTKVTRIAFNAAAADHTAAAADDTHW